ncbi:MAG: carbohydrate binding domain-containing protein, partial [Psychrobacillus sp.]
MREFFKIVMITVLCTSVALGNFTPLSISHAEEASSEIRNPGFEEVNNDPSTIPGWSMENNSSTPAVITNTISHEGSHSLHFKDESDKAGSRIFSDRVSVTPGKSYTAKVMTNVVKQTHNIVYEVHYYDKDNRKLTNNVKTELFGNLPKDNWTELKVFTEVPANAAYARLAFYSGVISLTEAYFDDVTWEQAVEDIPLEREYASPVDLG